MSDEGTGFDMTNIRKIIFRDTDGRAVIDERCTCGHLKSEHGVYTYVAEKGNVNKVSKRWHPDGHGGCNVPSCHCNQFTWTGWVYEGEKTKREELAELNLQLTRMYGKDWTTKCSIYELSQYQLLAEEAQREEEGNG